MDELSNQAREWECKVKHSCGHRAPVRICVTLENGKGGSAKQADELATAAAKAIRQAMTLPCVDCSFTAPEPAPAVPAVKRKL